MKMIVTTALLFVCFSVFCQYESIKPQGIYSSQFIIDEVPRNITYYMPAAYGKNDTALYPLVIFLHEENSSAKKTITQYGDIIQAMADASNAVIMYPDAVDGHWHSKPGTAQQKDSINDVSFVTIMLDFFVKQYHCNPSQVYLAGIGNGGNMCYRINCESPYEVRAIRTINATGTTATFTGCRSKKQAAATNIVNQSNVKTAILKALTLPAGE